MGLLGRRETDEQVLNMFESKEEVERTMLALKIFPDMGHVGDVEQEEPDTDEEEYAPQVFPEHTESETRYTRSLYYGVLPATDRPSLPLTRLPVDQPRSCRPRPEVGQARHGQGCRHLPPSLRWTQLSRARVALPGAIESTPTRLMA